MEVSQIHVLHIEVFDTCHGENKLFYSHKYGNFFSQQPMVKFKLARITKHIYNQNHELETLLCQARIVKNCEKQSIWKDDII